MATIKKPNIGQRESTVLKLQYKGMRRVYVFSIGLRLFHWLNALAIVVLAVTGILIAHPPAFMTQEEASARYLFGNIRFIHFAAAYIFTFNLLFRIYLLFTGNRFERWYNFIPYKKSSWQELWAVVKHDVLFIDRQPLVSMGHNALAGFSYTMLFLLMIFTLMTGFALYEPMSDSVIADLFVWVSPLFGGDAAVRNWHHITLWGFVIFTFVHLYLVAYHDYVEGRGETSSIIGGWKFIEHECIDNEECTDFKPVNKEKEKTVLE